MNIEKLKTTIPNIIFNEPLSKHCTARVGGKATAFVSTKSIDELIRAHTAARELDIPYHILGGGSNTLFSDHGFDGLVIKNMASTITIAGQIATLESSDWPPNLAEIRHEAANPARYISFLDLDYEESPGDTLVRVDSGANLTALIVKTLDAGLTGLQWFGGIPGVIGGAIYNNIHGGTHFISERLVEVLTVDKQGSIHTYKKTELEFGYDFSRFHREFEVILTVEFMLTKANSQELARSEYTFREWVKRKSQMQPKIGSMGSTFQNISQEVREKIGAPTTAAGWLIDQCGLKGQKVGQAQIATEHANFIVNLGGATATDIYKLMRFVQKAVKRKFGVDLKPEVFLIGHFEQ